MGTANGDLESTVRKVAVKGLEIGKDLPAGRVGQFAAVIAEDKHERLFEALLNDTAERCAINVDAGLAADVVVAELQCGRAAERMSEHAEPLHVEASGELA